MVSLVMPRCPFRTVLDGGGATGEAKPEAHMPKIPWKRLLFPVVFAAIGACLGHAFGLAAAEVFGRVLDVSAWPTWCAAVVGVASGLIGCMYSRA